MPADPATLARFADLQAEYVAARKAARDRTEAAEVARKAAETANKPQEAPHE